MASERRKVKYHWSSTSDRCSRKRSCLREPSDVAPSSRPAHSSVSRSGGASSPKRLKAQKEDDVSWGSSRHKSSTSSSHSRRRSSTSSSSSHSSGPGAGRAACKRGLIPSSQGFLSSGGSPLRSVRPSLEEMASLEEEACSLKVSGPNALQTAKPFPPGLRCWRWSFGERTLRKRCLLRSLGSSQGTKRKLDRRQGMA